MRSSLFCRVRAAKRGTLETLWTSADWSELKGATFLATPTVFGQRLLVPVLVQGAYALQGEAGRRFVTSVEGSSSNVIGLPLEETLALLEREWGG